MSTQFRLLVSCFLSFCLSFLASRFLALELNSPPGYWLLAIDYWLLAIGSWLLAIGSWLLALGC